MLLRRVANGILILMWSALAWVAVSGAAMASEYHGQVTFGGLPVPGSTVTVTATQGSKKVVAISDDQGVFYFPDLADGTWAIDIEMTGFAAVKQEVTVAPNGAAATFELKLLSLDQIRAEDKPVKVDATAAVVASVASVVTQVADAKPGPPATGAKGSATAAKGAAGNAQVAAGAAPEAVPAPVQDATAQQANDGFLINGSMNNAATSQFSMNQAFGNNRNGGRSLYNGNIFLRLDNTALDAAPFPVSGFAAPKPQHNNFTLGFNFGGPVKIPRLMPRGPYFGVNYTHTENSSDNTQAVLIPTGEDALDNWNLASQQNVTAIYVPTAGLSAACLSSPGVVAGSTFANNVIPAACVSHAATVLLTLYPQQPNLVGNPQYNYQLPLTTSSRIDTVGISMQKQFGNKNNVGGRWNFSDTRSTNPSIFGFNDATTALNINTGAQWNHRFTQRLSSNVGYQFSRSRNQLVPAFANMNNIESTAGIAGGSTDSRYWGPPSLGFSSSIVGLSDGVSAYNRNETNGVTFSMFWNHLRHNIQYGGDFSRREYNYLTQANPDGSLQFTGAATRSSAGAGGSDLADFLLGIPDASQIAYGNADKYLRQSVYDLYVNDDFRVNPEFSMNVGVRWEFGAPVTELKGRLVNLDVAPGFASEAPVLGSSPKGTVTGQSYPNSLMHPDYSRPEPHVGIAWRPISGSSLLIRSGYDVTNDTSVYQSAAYAMAQQFPLSTSLSISNSAACGFTLASPFVAPLCSTTSPDTFAIDPNFKVGYVQTWNLSVQRDLPFSLQMVATYTGIKGTRGVQEFLPNSCPPQASGVSTTCNTATSGYRYRTSNGNLTREAGSIELRRRLRNGFQARLLYTYAKMLDDDFSLSAQGSVTSGAVAQDWTNLRGQRGLSTTDQRHVLTATAQYTTGMGLGGKTLMSGWKGAIYKEWTIQTAINSATGLPETPIDAAATASGTGVTGTIRPDVVGSPYASLQAGYFLNAAAYAAPAAGQWGDARRDSIAGPNQFSMSASMNRTFRLHDRYTLDATLNAANVLNHVVISGYNTTWTPPAVSPVSLGNRTFGAPLGANQMRQISVQLRVRF
jgi:trimeric autotransporter adhesin